MNDVHSKNHVVVLCRWSGILTKEQIAEMDESDDEKICSTVNFFKYPCPQNSDGLCGKDNRKCDGMPVDIELTTSSE